jgi:splicing factor U2AF subunit
MGGAPPPLTQLPGAVQVFAVPPGSVGGVGGGGGGMGNVLPAASAMSQQATRHARRIYVGGLPPQANEQNIQTFFSNALAAVGGTTAGPGMCVVNVYINYEKKFAFVEMRTGGEAARDGQGCSVEGGTRHAAIEGVLAAGARPQGFSTRLPGAAGFRHLPSRVAAPAVEEASNDLALDGIMFEGVTVRIRRPADYNAATAAALGPSMPNPNLNLAAIGLDKAAAPMAMPMVAAAGLGMAPQAMAAQVGSACSLAVRHQVVLAPPWGSLCSSVPELHTWDDHS